MVNKKQTQPSKKSPVIAEPALANRPKRNISPKSWDNSSMLSWREEQQLKKALYASLHPPKRQSSDPGEQSSTNEIPVCKSDETTPHRKKTRSFSTERLPLRPKAAEIRRHSSGSSNINSQKKTDQSMSEERETRSRTRLSSNAGPRNPVKLEPQSASVTDETSQDSMISSASQPVDPEAKRKYRAQRKFAQMHGFGFGYTYTPTTTPVKQINTGSTTCRTPPIKVFPKRAKTEDFLTFLCLRGTHALPPHLDMYNFSRDDSNGADSSNPATPSNGRRPGSSMRESSPSSSSTSVSQDDNFCPITPLKNLMTPIKKAARASAGTPEIARGLATRSRHTKNSQRTAFGKTLDVTPNSSPGKRKSPLKLSPKGSPAKMAKSDRIKMKKKAVATLTTLDKRSRKKSLFNDGSEDTLKKVTFADDVARNVTDTVCSCNLFDCFACNPTKPSSEIAMTTCSGDQSQSSLVENHQSTENFEIVVKNVESTENINFTRETESTETVVIRDEESLVRNETLAPDEIEDTLIGSESILPIENKNSKSKIEVSGSMTNPTSKADQAKSLESIIISALDPSVKNDLNMNLLESENKTNNTYGQETGEIDLLKTENQSNQVSDAMTKNIRENCQEEMFVKPFVKPLHVKCKDFPIRASTCIVPKPPPPYSLIKAMRQLENSPFGPPISKPCNHSICYHSNTCCHSNEACNNNESNCSVDEGNVCCHGDANNNNTNCQKSVDNRVVELDNRPTVLSSSNYGNKNLEPLPLPIMSTYMH